MLQTKASAEASSWANKKKEAMEKAKRLREDKKYAIDNKLDNQDSFEEQNYTQQTAQKKFQHAYSMNDEQLQTPDQFHARSNKPKFTYNPSERPPSSEELAQARNSLRLLKSKKKNQNAFLEQTETKPVKRGGGYQFDDRDFNEGQLDDDFDDICDETPISYNNNKPIKNTYNSNNKFGGSLPSIDNNQNTNNNYRKVFKPDLNSNQEQQDNSKDLNFEMNKRASKPTGFPANSRENFSGNRPPLTKYNDQSYNSGYDDEVSTNFSTGSNRTATVQSKTRAGYGAKSQVTKDNQSRAQTSLTNNRNQKPSYGRQSSQEYDPMDHDNFVIGGTGYGNQNKYGLSNTGASTVNKAKGTTTATKTQATRAGSKATPYSKENIETESRMPGSKVSKAGGGFSMASQKKSNAGYGASEEYKQGNRFDANSFDEQPINSSYSQANKAKKPLSSLQQKKPTPSKAGGIPKKQPATTSFKPTYDEADDTRPIGGEKFVPEVEYNERDFVECPQGCGRRFNPDVIEKHAKICLKVFQSKRKKFNSANHRATEELMEVKGTTSKSYGYAKKNSFGATGGKAATTKKAGTTAFDNKPVKGQKSVPKWKAQSEAFRAGMRAARGQQLTPSQQVAFNDMGGQNDDLTPCQFCGRKFNENAYGRHVKFCEQKSKMDKFKKGGKAGGRKY